MEKASKESLELEQDICIDCGFCCDGTLFDNAYLQAGEHGNLPEKMEENYFKSNEGEGFNLPCPYFNKKCTIYEQKKAHVCSDFRCKLLKDFAGEKITLANAKKIVSDAMVLRNEIYQLYQTKYGSTENMHFRKLLLEIKKIKDGIQDNAPRDLYFEVLMIKCNIFEALLIKTFKSVKYFENLMEAS